ncbi:hypothetical protein OHA25_37660 [Nonomuraea sp. NBC_00507]|uniref:hypothetical protein n=1 Tax=Nonomuraea sp. NBC_00507 TaxID=2976002 RepID=UPI002E18EB2E
MRDALSGWTTDADREMTGMGIACLDTREVIAGHPVARVFLGLTIKIAPCPAGVSLRVLTHPNGKSW